MSEFGEIREKLGQCIATAKSAHQRIDGLETGIRTDLALINTELKAILAWMNQIKGWIAAGVFAGGLVGALVTEAAKMLFHH